MAGGEKGGKRAAALLGERVEVALLHQLPLLHNPDAIKLRQLIKLMGHHQGGLVVGGGLQRAHHQALAIGVQAGGRLIQQQQPAGTDQRPGDGNALGLADGEAGGILADRGV